jgi:hypothetical protein
LSGGEIDDGGNDEERRNAIGSIVEQFRVFAFDGPEIADAAADVSAGVLGDAVGKLTFRRHLDAAVGDGFDRRRDRIMNKGAHFARLFLSDECQRVEVFYFAGKLY